jgi:hypothetical protein
LQVPPELQPQVLAAVQHPGWAPNPKKPPHFGHDDAMQLPELLPLPLLLELAPPEHAPSVHDCPAEQPTQAAPPVPQLAAAPLVWHVPVMSQHPVWHVVGEHPASPDPPESPPSSPEPALESSPVSDPRGASSPPDDEPPPDVLGPPLLPDPPLEASDVAPDAVPTG